MWALYAIAAVPAVAWALLWAGSKKVTKAEAIIASAAGLVCCLIFQVMAVVGMTSDTETWSGRVTSCRYDPGYTQWYMKRHSKTYYTGTGKNRKAHTRVWYTRETRWVPPEWGCSDTVAGSHSIDQSKYERMASLFGGAEQRKGMKDNYDSGDPYTYIATPKTGYIWPTVDTRYWENRVKACPSVFSFQSVEGVQGLYEYPSNPSWDRSGRLLGSAKGAVDLLAWDQLNARLGPTKWVNLIAIGFGDRDKDQALLQQAKWVGGKQNDLVLCWGGSNDKPTWTFVFGWSESEIAKRDLETILLDKGFGPETLPLLEKEIVANYRIKDFSKFDYLTVEPPAWAYGVLVAVIAGTQILMGLFFFKNEFDKDGVKVARHWRYSRSY